MKVKYHLYKRKKKQKEYDFHIYNMALSIPKPETIGLRKIKKTIGMVILMEYVR